MNSFWPAKQQVFRLQSNPACRTALWTAITNILFHTWQGDLLVPHTYTI